MKTPGSRSSDLHDIIDQKLTALVREMEEANWSADEVVAAMSHVLKNRWLDKKQSLDAARGAVSGDFVSDGNEG